MRVHVARAHAKVRGDLALHLRALDEVALVVNLLHHPHGAGDGYALAHGGRLHDGPQLLRLAAHGEFLVLREHRVKAEVVGHPLAREPHDEPARLGPLDVVDVQQVSQQHPVVVGAHAVERRQREHAPRELGGREFAGRGERGHGLVVQQAVGEAVQARGLHPAVLQV